MAKPNYIMVAAVSIDGFIAPAGKQGSSWTSPEDKQFLHQILDTADVVIVGNTTYKIAKEPLSKRNCIILTKKVKDTKQPNKLSVYLNPKNVDLKTFIEQKKYRRVVVLGGAQAYSYCLEQKMVNEIYLTVEPVVFGRGLPLFRTKSLEISNWKVGAIEKLNKKGSILIHYKT